MRAGIVVGLIQPRIGFAITEVTSIAVSVPSLRGADAVGLLRLRAMAGRDRLAAAVVEDAHRAPGGGAREVGGDQALGGRPLLGAEAAAHVLAGHVHAVGIEARTRARAAARASQMPCVETYACSSSPSHCATAQCGSSACCTCAEVAYSASMIDVRLGHAGLDVAGLLLDGILLQPLLGERLGGIDDEAELGVARRERRDGRARRRGVLARERRDGRAGVGGLAL